VTALRRHHKSPRAGLRRIAASRSPLTAIADRSGVAAVEFALCLPLMIGLGMYGMEVAYMASVNMQISQIALSVADNASRLEQTDNSGVTPTVTESDIDSVMDGALREGKSIDLQENGRVILSSLEKDATTGKQYIHWQRCSGELDKASAYGDEDENNGLGAKQLTGMGASGSQVTANDGSAVMYAEVYYKYPGLFGTMFTKNMMMKHEAAFLIRDQRNLTAGVTGAAGASAC
jgi:Flp pilus assembly protein TadG